MERRTHLMYLHAAQAIRRASGTRDPAYRRFLRAAWFARKERRYFSLGG